MTSTAETDTLPAKKRPRSTSVPRTPGVDASPSADGAEAETAADAREAPVSRGRGTRKKRTPPPETTAPPEPVTAEELQLLGALLADATALGQTVEDYVADLRKQLAAYSRLEEVMR